jgi:hypothetical protein
MLCVSKNLIEVWMSGDGALVCGLAPSPDRRGPMVWQAVVCVCVWCVCVCVCVCVWWVCVCGVCVCACVCAVCDCIGFIQLQISMRPT